MREAIRRAVIGALAAGGSSLAVYLAVNPIFEGRRQHAYLDIVGVPTICEGWTHGVKMGDRATSSQCDAYAQQGLAEAQVVWERWVPAHVREGMGPVNEAAFLLFITNVGPGKPGRKDGFVWLKGGGHSTMLRMLKVGNVQGACGQFRNWANAGGVPVRGLAIRRVDETGMCNWPAQGSAP